MSSLPAYPSFHLPIYRSATMNPSPTRSGGPEEHSALGLDPNGASYPYFPPTFNNSFAVPLQVPIFVPCANPLDVLRPNQGQEPVHQPMLSPSPSLESLEGKDFDDPDYVEVLARERKFSAALRPGLGARTISSSSRTAPVSLPGDPEEDEVDMLDDEEMESPVIPAPAEGKKRSRTAQACEKCRIRKARCFGGNPCNRCTKRGFACEFSNLLRSRGPANRPMKAPSVEIVKTKPRRHSVAAPSSTIKRSKIVFAQTTKVESTPPQGLGLEFTPPMEDDASASASTSTDSSDWPSQSPYPPPMQTFPQHQLPNAYYYPSVPANPMFSSPVNSDTNDIYSFSPAPTSNSLGFDFNYATLSPPQYPHPMSMPVQPMQMQIPSFPSHTMAAHFAQLQRAQTSALNQIAFHQAMTSPMQERCPSPVFAVGEQEWYSSFEN